MYDVYILVLCSFWSLQTRHSKETTTVNKMLFKRFIVKLFATVILKTSHFRQIEFAPFLKSTKMLINVVLLLHRAIHV